MLRNWRLTYDGLHDEGLPRRGRCRVVNLHLVCSLRLLFSQVDVRSQRRCCKLLNDFPSCLDLENRSGVRWVGHRYSAPKHQGFGFSGRALRGEQLLAALVSSVDCVVKSTYRTAWAANPRCRCPYAYGSGLAVGPQTGERSWELLRDLWRAVAPLMAPWCAKEDVPTSAKLELLRWFGGSRVRWRRDDEALFGGQGNRSGVG